jgi:uncharacterized membrane protein YoaK (UPF0700 family)
MRKIIGAISIVLLSSFFVGFIIKGLLEKEQAAMGLMVILIFMLLIYGMIWGLTKDRKNTNE